MLAVISVEIQVGCCQDGKIHDVRLDFSCSRMPLLLLPDRQVRTACLYLHALVFTPLVASAPLGSGKQASSSDRHSVVAATACGQFTCWHLNIHSTCCADTSCQMTQHLCWQLSSRSCWTGYCLLQSIWGLCSCSMVS